MHHDPESCAINWGNNSQFWYWIKKFDGGFLGKHSSRQILCGRKKSFEHSLDMNHLNIYFKAYSAMSIFIEFVNCSLLGYTVWGLWSVSFWPSYLYCIIIFEYGLKLYSQYNISSSNVSLKPRYLFGNLLTACFEE